MVKKEKVIPSVRKAKHALTLAIRDEKNHSIFDPMPHSTYVARREKAVRELILAVRAETRRGMRR
jgi:hypothetical protein